MTIKDGLAAAPGVRVIFQNADDTVISEGTTDATGSVVEAMPNGGNVSIIRTYSPVTPEPPGGQRVPEVYTYVGVKNGDVIELGKAAPLVEPTPSAIVVKVPELDGTVTVKTPCGSGSGQAPNVAITVSNCPTMVDLYITQNDSGMYMKAPYGSSIDASAGTLVEALASTVTGINTPENSSVEYEERLYAGNFMLYTTGNKRVDQTPQQVDMPSFSGVDSLVLTRVNTDQRGRQITGARTPYGGSGLMTVDGSAHLMPYVMGNVQYTPTGISWLEVGPGTVDGVMVTMSINRGAANGGTPGLDSEYIRAIIAPHGGMQMRLPMLPAVDGKYNPTIADQIGGAIGLVKSSGGYDQLRSKAFASTDGVYLGAEPAGYITLSYNGQEPGVQD